MKYSLGTICLLVLCLFALTGCGADTRRVALEPQQHQIRYDRKFSQACAAPAPDGGYDLVMTIGGGSHAPQYGTRIFPSQIAPLSEIVHIHVAWRPTRSSKSDFPAATNSTIQWYLFSNDPDSPGYIEYQGIGFVKVIAEKYRTTFYLEDLTIKANKIVGNMKDPLGPTRLHGLCEARNDSTAVSDTLQTLDAHITSSVPTSLSPATEPAGMAPARTNVGP